MRSLPDNNLSYPVAITLGNGSFGSGFFLNTPTAHYLVTAKHVLYSPQSGKLINPKATCLAYAADTTTKLEVALDLSKLEVDQYLKAHPAADVAVIKLGTTTVIAGENHVEGVADVKIFGMTPSCGGTVGVPLAACRKYSDVLISNRVFVFGYPRSLGMPKIQQIDPNRPLLRHGIIAGKNEAAQTIIIDCR